MKSKTKKVVENISDVSCESSSDNESDDKFELEVDNIKKIKKPTKPIKNKKKVTIKDSKTLVEGDDFKKLQRKAKKLPNLLIILIEKIINM